MGKNLRISGATVCVLFVMMLAGEVTGLRAATVGIAASAEAVIQGGSAAATDVDEAAAGYLHLKYNTALGYSRKIYFQFDLSGMAMDTSAPAALLVNFYANYQQRVQLWALQQTYPGFNENITWNTAQANELTSNDLLESGVFTASKIGVSALIPVSSTNPYSFAIPRLGDVVVSNRVTLVLTGVSDPSDSASGLRLKRASTLLNASTKTGFVPPAISGISPQTVRIGSQTGPIAFTIADDRDDPATLHPLAVSSDTNVVPVENVVFGGSGSNRTVTVSAGNQPGTANVTIRVVDSQDQTGSSSFAVTVLPALPPPVKASHYDVYFAGGQSNMDGRGSTNDLTGALSVWNQQQPDIRVYYANPMNLDWANPDYDTGWQMFGPGYSVPPGFTGALPSTRFGPELSFGRTVADANPDRTLAIIKVSQGGTTLSGDWKPRTGYMYLAFTNMSAAALQTLTNDGSTCTLRGMIWHQGEGDGSSSTATYQARLTEFIAAIREDLGVLNLPFVVGELATNRSLTVRQAQMNVAQTVPYVGFASSSNLVTLAPDDPHFNSAGVLIMGQRMAAALEIPQTKLTGFTVNSSILTITGSGLGRSEVRLLSTANLALPKSLWTAVSTNRFDVAGTVHFDVPVRPGTPAEFFMLD